MIMRDALLNEYFYPLTQIYQITGSYLMYKEGQAFCRFLSETFGDHKIRLLFENAWKYARFDLLLSEVLGMPVQEIDRRWRYYLKKKYYPLLAEAELPGTAAAVLTRDGIHTKPAFCRINGRPYVVFYANRTGYSNIYWMSLEGDREKRPEPELLVAGERTSEFESFHLLQSRLDVNKGGQLAFVSKSQGKDAIYIFDLKTRTTLRKLQFRDLVYLSSPSWSPDGKKIVFSAIDFSGKNDLYVVEVESGRVDRLTNDFYDDRDPAWSPGGQWIAFSSDRTEFGENGAYNLFLYDLRDRQIYYITYGNRRDYSPAWSPDGRYLAFSSDRDGAFNLWVIEAGEKWRGIRMRPLAESSRSALEGVGNVPVREPFFSVVERAFPMEQILRFPQLKRLTSFATGAFDPEWTDSGEILFSAFENFSFQLQRLDRIPQRLAGAKNEPLDPAPAKFRLWIQQAENYEKKVSPVKYRRKYSLDLAQSYVTQDPVFGTYGGAQLAISDILGNHQYYFLIYNDATTKDEILKSMNIAVTRLDLTRRINMIYGLYHFAGRFYNYYDGFFYERRYGGFFGLSYPFSIFRRIEASVNVRRSEKEWFSTGYFRRAFLISNFVSFVHDNSLWGSTGPVDGSRYLITLGNTVDIRYSKVNFSTVIVDYRRYFRLGRRVTFATRAMGSFNVGKETVKFFMGGSWDLRGYKLWSLWGEKMVLLSQELRFPFIDRLAIRFPFGAVGFSSIRGALFWDQGNAWDGSFRRLYGSFGLGMRFNFGGALVLRLDYGKKYHVDFVPGTAKIQELRVNRKPFLQFFFGWDF
jgi:Tol biopolymer transport system component